MRSWVLSPALQKEKRESGGGGGEGRGRGVSGISKKDYNPFMKALTS
jgi:hypothetical protein